MNLAHYDLIAELFVYPRETFADGVERVHAFLAGAYPKAADILEPFCDLLPRDDLNAMQELFTRSFDVQAITTLDVGYVLFGDDYKRGELLANLNREHRDAGNECGIELADHLPNMLKLLPKLSDAELVEELVQELIAPAVKRMAAEFQPERLVGKDKMYKKHHRTLIESSEYARTIYRVTLQALLDVLDTDFDLISRPLIQKSRGFLPMVKSEMEIERSE